MKILKVGPSNFGELGRLMLFIAGGQSLIGVVRFANGYDWASSAIGAVVALIAGVLAKRYQHACLNQADKRTEG